MTNTELKQWLRDNSSGVYRPAREAANLIGQLERELNAAEKNLADAQANIAEEIKQGEIYLREIAELKERMAAMPNEKS
jgi:hypothetical protein